MQIKYYLRTLDQSSVDEYSDRLDESGGTDSCPTARDFWIPGSTKLLRKTDAVYMLEVDGNVLAAIMISETSDTSWKTESLAEAAEFLFTMDAWHSPDGKVCTPADAVSSADIKTSVTKSISRYESAANTNTAADWYITESNGASPGLPNNPNR